MRTVPGALLTHFRGEVTTPALLWRVIRRDGQEFGFTSHDRDIQFLGLLYQSVNAANPAALVGAADLRAENTDIELGRDMPISAAEVAAGLWKLARVEVYKVNASSPSDGGVQIGTCEVGRVRVEGQKVTVELRGFKQRLQSPVGYLVQASCQATLGDANCKVDLGPLTVTGTLTSVADAQNVADSSRGEATGWFDLGVLTWTSGPNAGGVTEVKVHQSGGVFQFYLPVPYTPTVGDGYSLVPGCRKRFAQDCVAKFGNGVNYYKGFPFVPGASALRVGGSAGT